MRPIQGNILYEYIALSTPHTAISFQTNLIVYLIPDVCDGGNRKVAINTMIKMY